MDNILKSIEELNKKIDEYRKRVKNVQEEIKNLKDSHTGELQTKDKELSELKDKLFACSVERNNIREEMGKKIEELNNSNLSKEEKVKQIGSLMVGEYSKLKDACRNMTKVWEDYGLAKDSLMELEKRLSNSRLEAIHGLEKTKSNQWTIIWVLLGAVILLSLSLFVITKKRKTNK